MQFTAFFAIFAVVASSALAAPGISEAEHQRREMIARQDGACTFASGDPPIPNGSNGCIPNNGLGGSPGIITCNNGVPTSTNCGGFDNCKGNDGSAKCSFLGF